MKHIRKFTSIRESQQTQQVRELPVERLKKTEQFPKGLQITMLKKMFKEINEATEFIMLEDIKTE